MTTRLALYARDARARLGLSAAAGRAGLQVVELSSDPAVFGSVWRLGDAVRAPGGLVAAAMRDGVSPVLFGPSPEWFVSLGPSVTGRRWVRGGLAEAKVLLAHEATFVKLADAKSRDLPARRYDNLPQFEEAVAAVISMPSVDLLMTTGWFQDIHSEYRVFTAGTTALTVSPYLVEDEMWSPELSAHSASFHDDAMAFVSELLASLAPADVPPAAALDVARMDDGSMVILEANQAWSAGIYGCDPDAVLTAVIAANTHPQAEAYENWLWRPDLHLA